MHSLNSRKQLSEKHLFICASWSQVILCLAYLESAQDAKPHNFLIIADPNKSRKQQEFVEIRRVLVHLGHNQVDWSQARQFEHADLHLAPSFLHLFPALPAGGGDYVERLRRISYRRIVAHGDGLNNHVYVDNSIAGGVAELVHYGFRLIEMGQLSTALPKSIVGSSKVVSFNSIFRTWARINRIFGVAEKPPKLENSDLLFCERYWGTHQYSMREDADLETYIRSVLQLEGGRYKRIIFRPTTRSGPMNLKWENVVSNYAKSLGIEFLTWSGVYKRGGLPAILNHPEAQLFLGNHTELGGLFAFDGSLSVLFGSLNSQTTVYWGDAISIENMFVDEWTPAQVIGQILLMRAVSSGITKEQIKGEDEPFSVSISSTPFTPGLIPKLTAIESSFSWRITKPLRVLGKLFLS
jgi:hypothetical protein